MQPFAACDSWGHGKLPVQGGHACYWMYFMHTLYVLYTYFIYLYLLQIVSDRFFLDSAVRKCGWKTLDLFALLEGQGPTAATRGQASSWIRLSQVLGLLMYEGRLGLKERSQATHRQPTSNLRRFCRVKMQGLWPETGNGSTVWKKHPIVQGPMPLVPCIAGVLLTDL